MHGDVARLGEKGNNSTFQQCEDQVQPEFPAIITLDNIDNRLYIALPPPPTTRAYSRPRPGPRPRRPYSCDMIWECTTETEETVEDLIDRHIRSVRS